MARLEKFTEAQMQRADEFVSKWSKLGLSTEPVTRERALNAITNLYTRAGLAAPGVVWLPCPVSAGLAAICYAYQMTSKKDINIESKIKKPLDKLLVSSLGENAPTKLTDPIRKRITRAIEAAVTKAKPVYNSDSSLMEKLTSVRAQIADNEHKMVTDTLRAHISASLDNDVTQKTEYVIDRAVETVADVTEDTMYAVLNELGDESIQRVLHSYFGGSLWNAAYCAWVDFLSTTLKVEVPQDFQEITTHSGYFWVLDGIVFASEHPNMISFDAERRMHAERGASVKYDSGWGIYHWHGTMIPGFWLEDKKSLKASDALATRNVEQRRAACEILGWATILKELKAKVIDSDPDPQIGTLVAVDLPGVTNKSHFLRVQCGTGREFAIGVPPTITKALDAQAWLVGLDAKDFTVPEVRA